MALTLRAARTPAEVDIPCTLSPIAASAAASAPFEVAVAKLDAAFGSLFVIVDVVTFSGAVCSSPRLGAHDGTRVQDQLLSRGVC